ncbi:hypothetical protein [Nocardioides sp. Arc9.136]|uniref:hypothetical protein n=1 Tax=Nocardioides sp. Arc9.136 TaxID=2996826 RepID=UPI002666A825|nr:hypothetical protein [Nocardioides sp. Arc9.136]WKN47109.1 hypothetical protein OSR43_13785 [Nocardioides sp. Arc9.136]
MKKLLASTMLAAVALTACGGSDSYTESSGTATSPASSEPPAPESQAASPTREPFAPDTGEYALEVGETRRGSVMSTTVLEIRDPYPPEYGSQPEPGARFIGVRLRTCVDKGAVLDDFGVQSAYADDFVVADARNNTWPSVGLSMSDFPLPRYPDLRELGPGDCVKGWLALQTPTKVKPVLLQYVPAGDHVADWRFPTRR